MLLTLMCGLFIEQLTVVKNFLKPVLNEVSKLEGFVVF